MASTSKASVTEHLEENRTRLCEEFAAVAGTDSAVAQCYLAENEWEMEVQTSSAGPGASCGSRVCSSIPHRGVNLMPRSDH